MFSDCIKQRKCNRDKQIVYIGILLHCDGYMNTVMYRQHRLYILCRTPRYVGYYYFINQLLCTILYSLTIYLLHYYPRHVSSINMPMFRRKNCTHTASGIFALCNVCTVHWLRADSALNRCTVQTLQRPKIPDAV